MQFTQKHRKISKVLIFYFSGTGNAKQIAVWFAEFAIKEKIDCQLVNIDNLDFQTILLNDPDDLILIVSPIHGFNYPKITLDFIRRFPKGKNRIVLMGTRGGMKVRNFVTPGLTGIAFIFSSFLLMAKGYRIVGQIPFDMPSNWISIHPALNKNTIKYIKNINYQRVKAHSLKVFSGATDFLAKRDIIQDLLISPVSLAYFLVGRFAFAKSFITSKDCNNCGLCVLECPVNAIEMINERPFWTFRCESCMRCINSCPCKAIETAHGLIAVSSILSSSISTFLISKIEAINFQSAFFDLMLFTTIFIVLLLLLYQVQHRLLQSKFLSKIIVFTSLTHYKWWGRYRSTINSKLSK